MERDGHGSRIPTALIRAAHHTQNSKKAPPERWQRAEVKMLRLAVAPIALIDGVIGHAIRLNSTREVFLPVARLGGVFSFGRLPAGRFKFRGNPIAG